MMKIRNTSCGLFLAAAVAACGSPTEPAVEAQLKAPSGQDPLITISSGLDLMLADEDLASRIVVEQIEFNLADVRLLGEDQTLPAGGLPLTEEPQMHTMSGGAASNISVPFPAQYRFDRDLAVYVRMEPTEALQNASIVVRARLYRNPTGYASALITSNLDSGMTGSTNPDGDPDRDETTNPDGDPDRDETTNPDGDPDKDLTGSTNPDGDPDRDETTNPDKEFKGSTNPDGDPDRDETTNPDGDPDREYFSNANGNGEFDCSHCQRRSLEVMAEQYVEFELRDEAAIDMVNGIGAQGMEIQLALSGAKWLTPSTVAQLEQALDELELAEFENREPRSPRRVIIDAITGVRDVRSRLTETAESIRTDLIESSLENQLRPNDIRRR